MKGKSKLLKRISAWALCLVVVIATMNMPVFTMEVEAANYTDPSSNIKYELDASNHTAKVVRNSYSGDITIPSTVNDGSGDYTVTEIDASAFYNSSVTSVSLPNTVTTIGNSAFDGCNNLISINLSSGLISIGNSAFNRCSSLTSIDIPNGVTSIGDYTFRYCTNLTNISLPDSITTIGKQEFQGCGNLKSIVIPANVTRIDTFAFDGCSSIRIEFKAMVAPSIYSNNCIPSDATIVVPIGSLSSYQTEFSRVGITVASMDEASPAGGGNNGGNNGGGSNNSSSSSSSETPVHHHTYEWVVTQEPTFINRGINSLVCTSCGHVSEVVYIGNDAVVYNTVANKLEEQINKVNPEDELVLELGDWHSIPAYLMERIIDCGYDVEVKYRYRGVDYDIVIPAGGGINLHIQWYGPLLMYLIYGK